MGNRKIQLAELIEAPITGEWGNEITDVNNQHIVKVIRTTNFTNDGEIDYSDITLRDIEYTKCEKKKLKYGDIILEKSGGTDLNPVGRVVFFDKNDTSDIYLTNNFTTTLRVKDNKINSRFLLLFLLYNYKYKGLHKFYNKTTGIQNLQVSNLIKNTYVPLPEIKIQSTVVETLDKIKNIIKRREKQINLLEELVKSRFIEMFGDPIRNEKRWGKIFFQEITNKIGDGLHGTPKYDVNGTIPFINGNNLIEGKIVIQENTKFVNEVEYKKYFKEMSINTVFLSINGTLGRLAFYNNEKIVLGKSVCFLDLKKEINRVFVYYLLKNKRVVHKLEENSTKSTIKNISLKYVRNFNVICPPLTLQNEFASFVTKTNKLKFEAEKSLKDMENLYESLMQKFFK